MSGFYFEALVNGANYFLKLYRSRCAFEDLKTYSDAHLSDIGLTRHDLKQIDQDFYFRDPTIRLKEFSDDRSRRSINVKPPYHDLL